MWQALLVLLLAPLVMLGIHAGLTTVRTEVWTTLVAIAVVGEVMYLGFRPPQSKVPTPVSVWKLRVLLAAVSLAAICAAWLFAAAAAARSLVSGSPLPWRIVALAGFLVAVLLAATPPYLLVAIRRAYREPDEGDAAYLELRSRIARWAGLLHLPVVPSLVVSRVPNELPHVIGAAGSCYLAVPSNYPEIEQAVKKTWPALADGLLDFTVAHELTHVARADYAWLTLFRALLSLLARWLVPGVVVAGLGSLLLGAAAPGQGLLVLLVVVWATAVMLLSVFAQMLFITRDREVLADQWAADLIGPERVTPLREAISGGGAQGAGGGSVLEAYLGFFVAYQGPVFGQWLAIGETPAEPDRGRSAFRRLCGAFARVIDRFADAQPRPSIRFGALGVAHDPGHMFRAREHGLMSGLTLSVLQAVLVIDGVLLGFRDLLRLEWIWLWACMGVLILLIFQPVRCMDLRPLGSERITAAIAKSHTWSVVVAVVALLLLALPAMVSYVELLNVAVVVLLFLLAAHAAAAYLGAVFLSCACP